MTETEYQEEQIEEKRTKVSVGIQTKGDTTYEIFEDQVRMKIIPNNDEPIRFTEWTCIKKYEEPIQKIIIETKPNVHLRYKYSDDGMIQYKVSVDQERKIVRDLRTGEDIETGPWQNSSEEKIEEAGRCSQTQETRQRTIKKKEVLHHEPHSLFGFSSARHTHYTIFHVTITEQRTVQTDYNGRQSTTEWVVVPGSEIKRKVGGGEERGWTEGY